jgi:hypothetical protein
MAFLPTLKAELAKLQIDGIYYNPIYIGSYSAILKYFSDHVDLPNVTENCARLGVAFCYSWMPTVKVRPHIFSKFDEFSEALQTIKQSPIDATSMANIVNFVGGSTVATSKFLHFLTPKKYAIWDSRVARAGYGFCLHKQVAKQANYLSYLKDISDLKLPNQLLEQIKREMPDATEMRIKEFALFQLGLQEN